MIYDANGIRQSQNQRTGSNIVIKSFINLNISFRIPIISSDPFVVRMAFFGLYSCGFASPPNAKGANRSDLI